MSNANSNDDATVFSLRIVSIDSYMKTPIIALDTCYSEFRANEIKQVCLSLRRLEDNYRIKLLCTYHPDEFTLLPM